MQPFVLSALLSFAIYQFMAYVEIPPFRGWLRIGSVNVNFGPAAARWAKRVLIAAITLVIVFGVLFVHERLSPLDAISRNRTNIVLGFLFGPLFAIWLNSVFNHPPGQPLSRGLVVGGIGLILFCLIGSAGSQTGKLLEQIGKKISGVKGLGLEVSLSEPQRKKDPSQGALQLAGKSSSSFESNSGSAGLGYVSQLDDIIRRDREYLKDLFGQTDMRLMTHLGHAEELAKFALKPPMKCLAAWLEANADSIYVNERLNLFVDAFRQVSTLDSDERRTEVSRTFVRNLAAMASDVEAYGAPPAVKTACAPLLQIFCGSFITAGSDGILSVADRPGLTECLRNLPRRSTGGPLREPAAQTAQLLSEKLNLFVADEALETRPYFAIAYASFMTQLGQYEAAAAILHGWLSRQKRRPGSEITDNWLALRARSMLAAYFEEWLLKQGSSAPTALRNEHLNNLGIVRKGLEDALGKSQLLKSRVRSNREIAEFKQPGACGAQDDAKLALWRRLFSSYVSIDLTRIQNQLRHPDYKLKFVESTNADIVRLANLDLSCLSEYPPPTLVYAQILDSYALNMVQYVKARKDVESSDDKSKRLNLAGRAVAYGLEITHDQAQQDLNRTSANFLERVASSDWVSARESLQQTNVELRTAMED
jgi:hypothetical protein